LVDYNTPSVLHIIIVGKDQKNGVRLWPGDFSLKQRLLFDRELQLQLAAIKYHFVQVDEMLQKINAFKQYYVRKQELVYIAQ